MKRIKYILPILILSFILSSCTIYVSDYTHGGDMLSPIIISVSCNEKNKRSNHIELTLGIGRGDQSFNINFSEYKAILSINAPGLIINNDEVGHIEYEIEDFAEDKYLRHEKGNKIKACCFQTITISVPDADIEISGKITISLHLYRKISDNTPPEMGNMVTLYYAANIDYLVFNNISSEHAKSIL